MKSATLYRAFPRQDDTLREPEIWWRDRSGTTVGIEERPFWAGLRKGAGSQLLNRKAWVSSRNMVFTLSQGHRLTTSFRAAPEPKNLELDGILVELSWNDMVISLLEEEVG